MKTHKIKKILTDEFVWGLSNGRFYEYDGHVSIEDGQPHGKGKMTEKNSQDDIDNSIRDGEWENGQFIKGTYYFPYIVKYIGSFSSSRTGSGEIKTFPDSELHGDGAEYHYQSKKDYINDKYSGYVKGVFKYGSLVKGEVLNATLIKYSEYKSIKKIILTGKIRTEEDIKHGGPVRINSGEIFYEIDQAYADGSDEGQYKKYKGEIDFDSPHGKGTMIFEHGSKYVGEWYYGARNGQGTLTHTNGDKYIGQWKIGEVHGRGTFAASNGIKYIGQFKNNKYHGQGTQLHPDADEGKYVGQWKDGNKSGQGINSYSNGDKYIGQWKEGEESGQGTYLYSNGRKHVGKFKNGVLNGPGTVTDPDGSKYVSQWKDNQQYGKATLTHPDGKIEKSIWKNGKLIK